MPSSPGGIRVNPNGQTAVVTFTLPNGGTPVAYSSKSGAGTISLPATVTTDTTFYFAEQTTFTVSALVGSQQSATSAGTTASVDLSGGGVAGLTVAVVGSQTGSLVAYHAADGTSPFVAKAAGNGKNGVIDWTNDDTMGYLLHLHAGPNSTTSAAAIGIGTDQGHAGGLLIAHKNDNFGMKVDGHPGSGIAAYFEEYGSGYAIFADLYAGAQPITVRGRQGSGYNDGVATSGSTTFTSASAAFTAGDVGKTLTQLTSKGAGDPFGAIPAGATITAVTNGTTVTMSAAATASGTGVLFLVGSRAMSASQNLLQFLDTDGTALASVARGSSTWNTPSVFTTNDIAQPAIKATGKSGQTSDIAQVLISGNGTPAWNVQASGKVVGAFGSYSSNAGQTTQSAAFFQQFSTSASVPAVGIKGVASQAGAQLDVQDSSGVTQSKFDKVGRFVTAVASAPVLGDLIDGQTALSHDASGNLIITSRIAGALKTATVTVA